ncbi:MAG TPA: hypothetical protein VGO62_19895 [Myxococcota bacterium]|jgi:hypothetical protein
MISRAALAITTLALLASCTPPAPASSAAQSAPTTPSNIALAPVAQPREAFAQSVQALREVDATDAPFLRDGWRYEVQHGNWMRTPVAGGDAQLLLTSAEIHGLLGTLEVSPDGRWVAYSTRPIAVDRFSLHVKDLQRNELVPPGVNGVDFSLAWGADNTLYYTKLDDNEHPTRVYSLKPRSTHVPQLVHKADRDVMVGAADHKPTLFVEPGPNVLAYRLDPARDVDGPRVLSNVAAPVTAPHPECGPNGGPNGGGGRGTKPPVAVLSEQ